VIHLKKWRELKKLKGKLIIKNYKETLKKINQAFSKQSVLILGLLAFNFIAIADILVDVAIECE